MSGLIPIIGLAVCACNNHPKVLEAITPQATAAPSSTNDSLLNDDNCIRTQAVPILDRAVFPKATFRVLKDSITGIESVELDGGDRLEIKNWGCEYYCRPFKCTTNRFQHDTTDLPFWLDKAVEWMGMVRPGILSDAPLDVAKTGFDCLKKYRDTCVANNFRNLKDEIACNDNEMREFFTFDRVGKQSDGANVVELTFAMGPL